MGIQTALKKSTAILNLPRSAVGKRRNREDSKPRRVDMVMSPAGLRTKNDCAGEGQQQFSGSQEGGVANSSQIPSLAEEVAPLQNMQKSWKEKK
jgi:hypothetical protein